MSPATLPGGPSSGQRHAVQAPRWRRVAMGLFMALIVLCAVLLASAWYLGNRSLPPPSLEARQAHLNKAIDWVLNNESALMQDPNSALWHMVDRTATLTGHPGLRAIVERANQTFHPEGGSVRSLWLRMTKPAAPFDLSPSGAEGLADYQAAFLSALSCGATERQWATSDGWRQTNQCRPLWRHMTVGDPFCSTHQMMGLLLLNHVRCTTLAVAPGLQEELAQDIRWMLHTDPLVKDAYIQRVLTLMWAQGEQAVEPVWLQRVMDAQQPDGGWMGRLQIPDLPQGMQLWDLRQWVASRWPGIVNPHVQHTDFHASAQGLLLMALAVQSAQGQAGARTASGVQGP
jgi:hypothetical protein